MMSLRSHISTLFSCLAPVAFALLSSVVCHAQAGPEQWPTYGGDAGGMRYSLSSQITRDNVSGLQVAWRMHTHVFDVHEPGTNSRSSFEATPVLWKNTLYFDTAFNAIFAVDAATGNVRWSYDPKVLRSGAIYIVTSRGVSLWHAKKPKPGVCGSDTVVVTTLDRRLIARDASTGEACPNFGQNGTVDLSKGVAIGDMSYYEFTSPPAVVGDTIVTGSTVGDNQMTFAASGAVRGFDAVTGKQKWSWEPLPWAAEQHPRITGSGNAWAVLSADPEHDLVFVPTGSSSVDYYGGTRPGDNKDADSIVALQASTGKKVWAFQLVHHDLWDYDTPSEPLLFTFRKKIPAVAITTKTNMVYVFNRLTGEPLFPIEERAVPQSMLEGEHTSATQPFSTLPSLGPISFNIADVHLQDAADQKYCNDHLKGLDYRGLFTPPSSHGSLVYPGPLGGANWGSSAFDPRTSMLYTRISSMPFIVREQPGGPRGMDLLSKVERKAFQYVIPEWAGGDPPPLRAQMLTPDGGGQQRDESPQAGTPYRLARQAVMTPHEIPCVPGPFGSIVAMNLDTGQKVWSVAHGQMAKGYEGSIGDGGVIATAGGLLFAASTNDPLLRAYDSASGKELWRGEIPVPSQATPMTYTIKGRQYVVLAAGGHGFIGKGQSDEVIAFALPASTPPAAPAKKVKKAAHR